MHDAFDPAPQITFCAGSSIVDYWHLKLPLCTEGLPSLGLLDIQLVFGAGFNLAPIDVLEILFVPDLLLESSSETV